MLQRAGTHRWRMGVVSRLGFALAAGLLLAGGAVRMDPRCFSASFAIVAVYGAFVWRVSAGAGEWLDWLNLVFDTTMMVVLLRCSGGTTSPLSFVVYLWFFAMLIINAQHGEWRTLLFIALVGWLVFALVGWGNPGWVGYLAVNSAGLVLFGFTAVTLLRERRLGRLDGLTQVLNRRAGLERLADKMRRGENFELAFIDLKNFKRVNDAHGHAVGDRVLRLLAARMKAAVRAQDLVIRYGGDEFLVVAAGGGLARRLQRVFEEPLSVSGLRIAVKGDIGLLSWCPGDGVSLPALLEGADAAMYRMKYTGAREDH